MDSNEVGPKDAECGKVNTVNRCFESADWIEIHHIKRQHRVLLVLLYEYFSTSF